MLNHKLELKDTVYYKRLYQSHDGFRKELTKIIAKNCNLKKGKWFFDLKTPKDEIVGKEVPIFDRESLDHLFRLHSGKNYSTRMGYIFKWRTFGEAGRLYISNGRRLLVGHKPWSWGHVEYVDQSIMGELQKKGLVRRLKTRPNYESMFL